MKREVAKVKVENSLSYAVRLSVQKLGGWKKFTKEGEKVLLKPNFNTDDSYPGSTDIDFLREVITQTLTTNPKEIVIGESSTIFKAANTEDFLREKGVYDLEKLDERVRVVNFDKGKWIKKQIPGGRYLKHASVPEILEEVDKIIFLPCLKTHCLAQYTGALKLSVGMMKPGERIKLHAAHIQEKIAELNILFKPVLSIMDARVCFIDKGPMSGPRRNPGAVLASRDRTKLDTEGVKTIQKYKGNSLTGIIPEELPQIKHALKVL